MDRSAHGDPSVVPELWAWFREHHDIWSFATDVARQAELAAMALYTGPDPADQQIMGRRLQQLKAELAGPSPSPIEQLLANRAALDWLLLHLLDHAGLPNSPLAKVRIGPDFREKMQEKLHRRFTRSVKALADVRRLVKRRAVRVSIADLVEGAYVVDRFKGIDKAEATDPLRGIAAAEIVAPGPPTGGASR